MALIFVNIIVDQIWLKATIFGLLMLPLCCRRRHPRLPTAPTTASPPPLPPRCHHDHCYHNANSTSTPGTPTPPPLPVNAGGRPSTGTRGGGRATSADTAVRLVRTHARPPTQEEGGGKPHVNRHRRRQTSSLASRQSSYVRPINLTTSIEMRGDSSNSEDDELEYGYRDSRRHTSYEQRGSSSLPPLKSWSRSPIMTRHDGF